MNGILVDTSIWIDHFRRGIPALSFLLSQDRVLTHPMVLGEIACGTPPDRSRTFENLYWLGKAREPSWDEVASLIDRERLYGLGCGWIHLTLLASALITPGVLLWTRDKRLAELSARFDVHFAP